MERKILLVEDNKTLAKLLAKKMRDSIGVSIDVAYSMAEAKQLIMKNDYFIALLDLNLPDAPNGEIVDYVLSKDILVIVLTASMDEETKSMFIDKDIVDYVYKGNMNDVNYIFTTIERLYKNKNHKIMIVDDAISMRNMTKKILEAQQYKKVYVAAHGEEAMAYFESDPDISLVLTDYNMPVKNGLELTKELREKYSKNKLGIIALTGVEEQGIASNFLKHGANDFIKKPFFKDELICRVNNLIESIENIQIIGNMANTDFMTGAYNRRYFYEHAEEYLQEANYNSESYALIMIDIDKFKNINDTYGHDAGDNVIKKVVSILYNETKGGDLVARVGGEEFCVLLKDIDQKSALKQAVKMRTEIEQTSVMHKKAEIKFTASLGITFNSLDSQLNELVDEADTALYRAKENGRNRIELYDREC